MQGLNSVIKVTVSVPALHLLSFLVFFFLTFSENRTISFKRQVLHIAYIEECMER